MKHQQKYDANGHKTDKRKGCCSIHNESQNHSYEDGLDHSSGN